MAKQPTLVWDDAPSSTPTKPVKLIFDDEFKPASSTVPSKPPSAPAPAKRPGKQKTVSWLGEKNLPVVGEFRHPHSAQALDVIKYPTPTQQDPQSHLLLVSAGPNGNPYVVEPDGNGGYKRKGSFRPAGPAYDPAADMASLAAMQANDDSQLATVRGVQGKAAAAPRAAPAPAQSPAPEQPRISDLMRNRETVEQWKSRRPKEVSELERDYTTYAELKDRNPMLALQFQQSAEEKYAKLQAELGSPDQFISQQRQVEMGMLTPPQLAMQGEDGRTASIQSLRGSDTQGAQASQLGAGVGEQAAQYDTERAEQAYQRGFVPDNSAGRMLQSFSTGVDSVTAGAARLLPDGLIDDATLNQISRDQSALLRAAGEKAGSGRINAGVERAGQGIWRSFGVMAPGVAIGAATGGAATGMALAAGLSQYGQSYQQATDAGLRGSDREQFATINAAAESLITVAFTKLLRMPGLEGAFAKGGLSAETVKGVLYNAAKAVGMSGLEEVPEEVLIQIAQNVNTRTSGVNPSKAILTDDELFDIVVQSFGAAGGVRLAGIAPSVPGAIRKANAIRGNAKAYVETPTGPADWAKAHPEKADEIVAAVEAGKPISRSMMEANSLPTMDSVKRSKWAADVYAAVRNQVADAAGLGEAVAATPDAAESQNPIPTEVQRSEDLRGRIDAERASQAAAVRNLGPEYEQRAQAIEAGAEDAAIAQDVERRMAEEESAPFSNSPKPKGPQFVNNAQPIEDAAEGSFGAPQAGDEVVDTREVEGKAGKGTRRGRVVSVDGDWATVQPKFGKQYKVPVGRLEVRGRPGTPKAKGLQEQPVGEGEDFVTPMGGSSMSRNTVASQDQQQGQADNVAQPNLAELTSPEQPAPAAQPQAEVPPTQQAEAGEPAQAPASGVGERTIQLDDMEMNDLRRKGFSSDQIAMMDDATLKKNGVVRVNKYNPPPLKGLKGGSKNPANNPAKTVSPVLTQGQQIRVISRAYPGTEIKPVAGEPGRYTVTLPNGKFLTVLYTPEVVEGPANRERLRQSLEARKAAAGNNTPVTEAELDNATITGFWRVSDGKGFETDGQGLVRILDSLGEGQATATALHEARHSLVSMGLMTEAEFDALAMEAARKSGQKPKTIADAEEMIAALAEKGDLGARGFIQTIRDIINRFMAAITGDKWKPNAQTATKRIQSGKVLRRAGKTESRREAAGRLSAKIGGDVRYSAEMNSPLQVESVDLSKFGWREQDDDYIYHVTSKPNADKIAKSGFSRGKSMFTAGSYPAYSKGKTFFTDRSGVKYWEDRVEQQLFHSHDDPPDVAVVRIPKSLVADMLQDDKTGTDDANHNAYYIDTNKLTAAQKKAAGGGADDAEVAGDIRYSADIPDSIAFKPDHELTTAQFIRRELPFVKQRIPWNESQWEKANKRMGEAFGEMAQGIYGKKWSEFVADTVAANDSVEDWSVGLSDMLADAPNLELMRTILPRAFDAAGVDMPKDTFDEAGGYGVPDDYVEMAGEDIVSVAGELVKELESRIPRMKNGSWKDSASHLLDEMLKISDPVEYLIRQHNDDVRRAIESGAKVPAEVRNEYENRNAEVGGDVRYSAELAGAKPDDAKDKAAAAKAWREQGVESPWFKRWFGKSKVVDAEGKPLVVYHGTTKPGFSTFGKDKTGTRAASDSGYSGRGFYFGDAKAASTYAGTRSNPKEGDQLGGVYPVYLSLKNPLQIQEVKGGDDQIVAVAKALGIRLPDDVNGINAKRLVPTISDDITRELVKHGHDGVIYRWHTTGTPEYMVVEPTQIKSATANTGTFSPDNADIRYSADPSQAKKERAAPPHYSQLPDTAATKESYQQVADLANPGFIQAVRDEIDRMRISNAEEVVKVAATLPGIRKQAAEIANSDQKAVEEMLLKGRPMTAVENEAARIVVNNKIQEALATGDKKLFDQAQELQYKYTNEARSEMGLALMIGRDVLETPYERNRRLVHETIVGIPASIADAIDAAFKYARELQQGGDEIGARKRLREAEKMKSDAIKAAKENYEFLKKIGLLPKDQDGWNELYSNTRKTSRAIREALARQATLYSKVMEYWSSAGILSGPVTHARNLAGTPANYALFKLPTRMLTDVASVLIGKKPAGMAVGEWNAARKAFWPGLWKGFAHGWDSLVQEVGTFDELHRNTYRGLLEGADGKYSIAGVKGRIARMVGWGPLRAADQFWKAFIGTMEANRAAYEIARAHNPNASPEALELHMLELVNNVRSAAWKKAMAVADEATFTEDGSVARKGAKNLVKAMRRNPIGKAIGLPFFIPFVDTPVNMAAQAMSYTPGVGLLSMVFKAMDNVATGKKKSDSQIEMLMRQVVGGAYYMILSGLKGLFDEDEKDEMDTVIYGGDHPTHPYAMRYNGKYYNYLGIEPIGTALAIMADFHNRVMKSDKPWDDKSSQAFISMVDQVANRPMLNGLNDVINIVTQSRKTPGGDRTEEFSRAGMNWLKNFGASWSPSLWRQTRQAMSQERLNTKLTPDETGGKEKYKTLGKRVIEQMGMHDIPEWMGWKAPAGKQYDIMGNVKSPVIADSSPMTDFFFRLVHPMRPSEDEPHPAFKMIANYNNNLPEGEEPYVAQDFQASYSDGGKRIAFSEKQAEQFYKLAGGANDIIFGKMQYDPNATGPAMVAQMRDFKEQVSEAGTIARRELERYVKGDIAELPSPEVIAEEVVKARKKSLLNKSSEKRVKFSAKKTDRETLEERAKQAADKDVARESLKRLGLRKP